MRDIELYLWEATTSSSTKSNAYSGILSLYEWIIFPWDEKLKTNKQKIRSCNIIAFGFRSLSRKASIRTLQPRRWCSLLELLLRKWKVRCSNPRRHRTGSDSSNDKCSALHSMFPCFIPTPRRCYFPPRYTITVKSSLWSRGHYELSWYTDSGVNDIVFTLNNVKTTYNKICFFLPLSRKQKS